MRRLDELHLTADDGPSLFIKDWPADHGAAAKRGIVVMHGLGEHCGRHVHVARFFNECGWSVRTYDHRGHGLSDGPRGHVPNDDAVLRDAKLVFDDFARQFDTAPLLLGHSMGGLFAARFATGAMSPIGGLILSSPALAIPMTGAQKLLLKVLGAITPALAVPNGLQTRYLSHDPAVEIAYNKDPLVHGKITPNLLNCMLRAAEFSHAHAAALAVPTLLVVASDDHLVDASGSDAFFARLKPGIGTIHRYTGFYHELFNEVDARRVFDDIRNWLNQL